MIIEGKVVTGVSGDVSDIDRIVIPAGVEAIGPRTFYISDDQAFGIGISDDYSDRGLTSVTLPDTLTSIGDQAFRNCSSLTSLTLPDSLTTIGERVFEGCSGITSLTLPNSLTTIGEAMFYGCSGITSLTLPDSLTTIGGNAFMNCSGITSLTLPMGLQTCGFGAFFSCTSLTSVVFRPRFCSTTFVVWAVSHSRNRSNWHLTTLKQSGNILRLIATMAVERRDVTSLDPDGKKRVFEGCGNESLQKLYIA